MVLGNRNHDRFWVAITVRMAFGFMFLIAALNIFFDNWDANKSMYENAVTNHGAFVVQLSKPFGESWLGSIGWGVPVVKGFLTAMPFIFAVLSLMLILGLFYRTALRLSAFFLVMLGLGKYMTDFKTGNTLTTLQDFMYAAFIILSLYVLSKEPEEDQPALV